MSAPFLVMKRTPTMGLVRLAAAINQAYTGFSHLDLLQGSVTGKKPLDGDTSGGFAMSSVSSINLQ
jgi:hypothetical protein